jgi:hypothetical protein
MSLQTTTKQRSDAARIPLVSATVYLVPAQLARIKTICAEKNRRISDFISDAVDDYLAKGR